MSSYFCSFVADILIILFVRNRILLFSLFRIFFKGYTRWLFETGYFCFPCFESSFDFWISWLTILYYSWNVRKDSKYFMVMYFLQCILQQLGFFLFGPESNVISSGFSDFDVSLRDVIIIIRNRILLFSLFRVFFKWCNLWLFETGYFCFPCLESSFPFFTW